MKIEQNEHKTVFLKKEKVSKDAYTFYFKRPNNFNFFPGQYIKLSLEIRSPDLRGSSRYFTISSSPLDQNFITITTRIIKSSFKIKLKSLTKGIPVKFYGPIGYFDFDYKSRAQNIFLAGGIGMTPYHSIIKFASKKNLSLNILLIASFSFKKDAVFFDELKEIEKDNPKIKIIYTLTKEQKSYPEFERGRIDVEMIKKHVRNPKSSNFFIVGPAKMTDELFETVKKLGVKDLKIFKEDFSGY